MVNIKAKQRNRRSKRTSNEKDKEFKQMVDGELKEAESRLEG